MGGEVVGSMLKQLGSDRAKLTKVAGVPKPGGQFLGKVFFDPLIQGARDRLATLPPVSELGTTATDKKPATTQTGETPRHRAGRSVVKTLLGEG